MNFLFYVGIIVPTVITIALFIIFIYCWFLQKARKEVLTKKYDPHGKMRSLGMSMNVPPPPTFCLMEDMHFVKIGEDNIAYDVSRSPSTEQDGRGRPMYRTYHDSGISAGLSPSQETEPRHGLAYRTCPDSGISGLVPHPAQSSHNESKSCCLGLEQHQRHLQLQQVCGDQIHIHAHHHHQQQQQQNQHLKQGGQHHPLIQSPTHPNHGIRYGEDIDKPNNPLQYNTLLANNNRPSFADHHDRQFGLSSHEHKSSSQSLQPLQTSILSLYHEISDQSIQPRNDQIFYHANQTTQSSRGYQLNNHFGRRDKVLPLSPNHEKGNRVNPLSPSVNFLLQPPVFPDINGHKEDLLLLSSPTKPLRHSNRDSGVVDIVQSIPAITERPDSQASQSSTTDSEDSGFRSSYCAAHNKAALSKQGNPLLKPLRKSRTSRSSSKPSKKAGFPTDYLPSNYPPPLITLSPKNLEKNVSNSFGAHNSSRAGPQRPHRSSSIPQQQQIINSVSNVRALSSPLAASQAEAALTFHDDSPTKHRQPSSSLDTWPTQSSNDQETAVKQCIDLNDISTHLSWKHLQNISSNKKPSSGFAADGIKMEPCIPGIKPGPSHQISRDQHIEQYGYSAV